MTFDEFKSDFLDFLENSTVNLGRRTTKTRQVFLAEVAGKFDTFTGDSEPADKMVKKTQKTPEPFNGSVMRIKPKDSRKALSIGKGVHAMTSSESARADEQLNRSPFVDRKGKKGK